MLAHVLTCLQCLHYKHVELLCIDMFPGIDPYNGIGQMTPAQLASVYDQKVPVTDAQFTYAVITDAVFANQDTLTLQSLANESDSPIPWVAAAAAR
jgi:hypothetical protein